MDIVTAWNDVGQADFVPVFGQVEVQARRSPHSLAIAYRSSMLSYVELDTRADELARRLTVLGVGPETIVAVCLPRSEQMVISLLAVLKTGGAYLPIDPDYPADRIGFMLADASPVVILATADTAVKLPASEVPRLLLDADGRHDSSAAALPAAIAADAPAYVIYTSGSTGRPKGVVISHRALANFLGAFGERLRLKPADRWLAVTTIAFDISNLELWLPLVSGAAVVLADQDIVHDPAELSALVKSAGVTIIQATPSLWQAHLSADPGGLARVRMLVGGETLSRSLADAMCEQAVEVTNVYGPTETTIWSTAGTVTAGTGPPPIGHPIWNTQVHVLDRELGPVPVGVTGELYIAGQGLARGYLNRPDLTAERFVANPYGPPGTRMYRTGDLACRNQDSSLNCLGRADLQVKIRGFRIECGEVETVLAAHPDVAQAAVAVREDSRGNKRLVGYVIPVASAVDPAVLRAFAAERLPGYMVPWTIVTLGSWPRTPNGKFDREALPTPRFRATPRAGTARPGSRPTGPAR